MASDSHPYVPVAVGNKTGYYAVHIHKVVTLDGKTYTPTGFECLGGKENNRKWRLSLRVLLPDGQRGRTLGHWLSSHNLEHLVPVPPARKSTTPGGNKPSSDKPKSKSKSKSKSRSPTKSKPSRGSGPKSGSGTERSSPEKRSRGETTETLEGSPTKQVRVGAWEEKSINSLRAGGLIKDGQPPNPDPADVIGAFMKSRLGLNSPPKQAGITTAIVAAATGTVSTMVPNANLQSPGPTPEDSEEPSWVKKNRFMGLPILCGRVIEEYPLQGAANQPVADTALPVGGTTQQVPLLTQENPVEALCSGFMIPTDNNKNNPAHSGILLPFRRDSGFSVDLARIFDFADGDRDCPTPMLLDADFSSPRNKLFGSSTQNSPRGQSSVWDDVQSISLIDHSIQQGKNSDGSSMSQQAQHARATSPPPMMVNGYSPQAALAAEEAGKALAMVARADVMRAMRERKDVKDHSEEK